MFSESVYGLVMSLWLEPMLRGLKAGLFPDKCLVCRREGALGCVSHPLPYQSEKHKITTSQGFLVWAAVSYENLVNQRLVKTFKFDRHKTALNPIVALMHQTKDWNHYHDYCLIPIPLHWSRRLWRGFNQAELIAQSLSQKTGLKYSRILARTNRTQPQSSLQQAQREQNLIGVFACVKNQPLPRKVILIDDVCTTGSTLQNAALTLQKAGVKEIEGLVFASQPKGK